MRRRVRTQWVALALLGAALSGGCPHRGDVAARDRAAWDRVATPKQYFAAVVSPWDQGVQNPLGAALAKVPASRRGAAIDLGTGIGNGIPMLARIFRRVVAIDYAPRMVAAARKRYRHLSHVSFAVADMRDLSAYRGRFDVAVAVNSVLLPSSQDVQRMLREAFAALKPGGILFGVFPSLESEAYIGLLTFERELARLRREEGAWERTERLTGRHHIDFFRGVVSKSEVTQKFYYRFELLHRLRRAGFTDIRIGRVVYPWRLLDDPAARAFRGRPGFWDWFVTARRPATAPRPAPTPRTPTPKSTPTPKPTPKPTPTPPRRP